jgi:vitamin B12 transporter
MVLFVTSSSFHFQPFTLFSKSLNFFNMKKEKKVWAITLIVLWWLAPDQVNAQQNQDSVRILNEVVVTATKFPKNQNETGKVLTVIDADQLQRSAGKDVSQLLNEQVGIVINGANSNPGKDKSVFLRGAGSQYTLILLDGISVNDPSGVGGAFDLRLLPVDQIERIEILKGSQSTLYGTDAIAGVINIITKKKGDKPVGGFGTLSYGSYNTFKGNAGITGSTNKLDYNLGYTRFQTDGISEAKDETGNGNFDKDGYTQNSFQLNFGIKPTDRFSIRPFVRYTDYDGKYDGGAFVDDKTAVYTAKLLNYGLTGQFILPKGAINLHYGRSNTERNFESAFAKYPFKGNFDNAEVFVNHDLGNNFQLLAGINYQNLNMADEKAVKKNPSINITSPYASFFIKNLSGFSAEIGGRYNNHSEFGSAFTFSINPSYLINKQVKLFVNYSTGFKAPTLSELYGQFGANDKLKPQESKSLDGGVRYISPNKKFDVRVTVFSRMIDNAIVYTIGYINLDKQDDYGFEIEPTLKVNDKLTLRAFYAFVDGEVTTKTVANKDTTFHNLIRRPKNSIGLNVGFQISEKLFVSANFKTFGARGDLFFDPLNNYAKTNVTLKAYQLLDVYLEYNLVSNKLKLFVDAKNILDQDYTEVYGYNTQRINLNTGISFKI